MTPELLLGQIAVLYFRDVIATAEANPEGTARYIIDCLSASHTAAIAQALLAEPDLASCVELKLPESFMSGRGLPAEVLTTKTATFYRNATITKPILLVANTGDDERQSLEEFIRLGSAQLQEMTDRWVRAAASGLELSEEQRKWWQRALDGLQGLRAVSLEQMAWYAVRTRTAIELDGHPIIAALGVALPALRLPREEHYFRGIKEKALGHASAWRTQFESLFKKRACYLLKQTPTQALLVAEDLQEAFGRVVADIPEASHPIVREFIEAPSGWNAQAAALAELEWETVKPLFVGLRREKFNLGKETFDFYEERKPDLELAKDDQDYLIRLRERKTSECKDEDTEFYEAHREELRDAPKLKSYWDRFIYGKPRETEDFVAGLVASLETLFVRQEKDTSQWSNKPRQLTIRCDRTSKKALRELNVDAGRFFAHRYGGLRALLGSLVQWEVGYLFEFPVLVEEWQKAKKSVLNRSTARASLQITFTIQLEVELASGTVQPSTTRLVWKFNPNTAASQFYDDWNRLVEHPLVFSQATRDPVSTKGRFQTVDLANVKTFVAVFARDRGSFVSAYKKENNIGTRWHAALKEAQEEGLVNPDVARDLADKFKQFEDTYGAAVKSFCTAGLSAVELTTQLQAYAALLETLCRRAKGDRNRHLLLRPLLQVGTVLIQGGRPTAVVTPWHPLRMAAMARKARRVASLVTHLLSAKQVSFGDTRLFFKDLAQELAHPFYPEVVLGWNDQKPELLALTDVLQDYSLHESPVTGTEGSDDTNENPTEGSDCVADLLQRYLALYPHEHANLSVVLYNCDSARLPQAVVERVGAMYEGDEDVRCQVMLRHADGSRLRDLYTEIIRSADGNADAFNGSEATQDFMARLRICIIADQAPPPDAADGRPYDLVFLQDVIARHARVEWYPENARPVSAEQLVPARWSRRRPAAKDDMKSVVYLCCPVQSREGWAFLTAATSFLKGDWDEDETRRLLPARQLDFQDPRTAHIFDETHNLGNWVANYDELLDRRQLLNQKVRVIRYKQSATQGRNVIISSKASLALLNSMVKDRLTRLELGLSAADIGLLATRLIDDASTISGDIVLRAAKRGRNANELLGVVLSRYLIRWELAQNQYFGWYFLDDYAEWLGQREEQIADLLALSPEQTEDGGLRLALIVSEAKYIGFAGLSTKRKESQKQLRDTMVRIDEAVFGNPERLDRDLWLARLSDLILDGVQFPANAAMNLSEWRRSIREGECGIYVRGYSHVFVPDSDEAGDCASRAAIPLLEDRAYQEVFGRPQLRELLLRYFRNESPMSVRENIPGEAIWGTRVYRMPTDRTSFVVSTGGDGKKGPSDPPPTPGEPTGMAPPPSPEGVPAPAPAVPVAPVASPTSTGGWAYPVIATLVAGSATELDTDADREWLKAVEGRTRNALQQFQLQAKVLGATLTPNSALLKFAGSANLTVDQILKRRSELLTTYGLPIIAVQPEPGAITLAVERPTRRVVRLQDLWARWRPDSKLGNNDLLIGVREADGALLILSPGQQHAPHTLIAGSTGSGKSVLMQNIILGIAATNTVKQAEIVLIDPKLGVDYFEFEGLPHLRDGVISEQPVALERLRALVDEMDARYRRFKAARVPNLAAYNRKAPIEERLPTLWLIHDEFAEWMLVEEYKNEVTSIVARLGVKARAAGIYLVFAAQRPDANVMPMQLRANLGNRLILRVDSEGTSEIALGEKGAERLLGKGHLLAKLEGTTGLQYAQVPFVDADFMEAFVREISSAATEKG
ncbi:MAG: FtsK/SpoIIIE domain-containing protein [Polyangiaceae bacterium]